MGKEVTPRAGYERIREDAVRLAGGPGDIPQRVAILHSIFVDSGGNHAFPEVALHGALWAYGFYARRGAVSRMITYRYFYDREERARRAYMLFQFSQGFQHHCAGLFSVLKASRCLSVFLVLLRQLELYRPSHGPCWRRVQGARGRRI